VHLTASRSLYQSADTRRKATDKGLRCTDKLPPVRAHVASLPAPIPSIMPVSEIFAGKHTTAATVLLLLPAWTSPGVGTPPLFRARAQPLFGPPAFGGSSLSSLMPRWNSASGKVWWLGRQNLGGRDSFPAELLEPTSSAPNDFPSVVKVPAR